MPADLLHSILSNVWAVFLVVLFFGGSIFVHELGHFLAARRRGVKVERFSIGFGRAIWSHRGKDGVLYQVAWIPLGGYVMLPQLADLRAIEGARETDATSDSGHAGEQSAGGPGESPGEAGAAPLPPLSYASKMIVLTAGAAFNILFAFLLACVLWVVGQPVSNENATTRIGYVGKTLDLPDGTSVPSPAAVAGLRVGDVILAVDGAKVTDWYNLKETLATSSGRDPQGRPRTVLTIDRDGTRLEIPVLPRLASDDRIRQIGIMSGFDLVVFQVTPGSLAAQVGLKPGDTVVRLDDVPMLNNVSFGEYLDSTHAKSVAIHVRRAGQELTLAIPPRIAAKPDVDFGLTFSAGMHMVYASPFVQLRDQVAMTFRMLGSLLNPHSDIGPSKLAGPIGIVRMLHSAAEVGIRAVLWFTILVNVNLAILNLLPVPVLDGGQMLFATAGRLRGRALPANFIMTTQSVFIVLILFMFIYVSFFDVRRLVHDVRADHATAPASPEKP